VNVAETVRNAASRLTKPQRRPEDEDVVTLELLRDSIQKQRDALEGIVDKLEGPEWRWFTTVYLPAETIRLALDAARIENLDPQYERKKIIADAQIRQNDRLIEKLSEARIEISLLDRRIRAITERISEVTQQRRRNAR
jgi:hypothetical protein